MFDFVDILIQKRQLVVTCIVIVINLSLISLLAPMMQTYRANVTARIQASDANQVSQTFDSSNTVANALSGMANSVNRATDVAEIKTLGGVATAATDITRFDKGVEHGFYAAVVFTLRSVGNGLGFAVRAVGGGFAFTRHSVSNVFGFFRGLAHVSSVIRPPVHERVPVITQLRAQQAAIIQSGTMDVSVLSLSDGAGGACDNGNGNGGYPMSWCNAPMDSSPTISYSSDPINRECTSYAYWYFTAIEGHANFHVQGDAKYWATSSNYPTHATPTVGAIAVETVGAYGHVAIVQALPGQKYAGHVVPAGSVLVSEMNYDWNGHFRYSYSPLSKFSAYIYP